MKSRDIIIHCGYGKVPKKHWIAFTRFLQNHDDFYQLLAISVLVEAQLRQIEPGNIRIR